MLQCYHAPAVFADRRAGLVLQVVLQDELAEVERVELLLTTASGESRKRMLPVDGIVTEESFSLYVVTLKARELGQGESICYRFRRGGEESETFTVPLYDLPTPPPLVVTETFTWSTLSPFAELYNTTDKPLDLYDFVLRLEERDGASGINPLASERGASVLPPYTPCVLRFLSPSVKNAAQYKEGREAFFAGIADRAPAGYGDFETDKVLLFEVDITKPTESGFALLDGCFELFRRWAPHTLTLLPREGSTKGREFRIEVNTERPYDDLACRRSGVWYFDARNPARGVLYDAWAVPTPGFCDANGVYPDAGDITPPAVLPIAPDKHAALTGAPMRLLFAVLGECVGFVRVFVKDGSGSYRIFRAVQNTNGYYEVTLPYALVRVLSKLEYYIEVQGGRYISRYGRADAPVTVPLEDRAGPGIIAMYPADGQVLEQLTTPTVEVRFEDISGVNLALCILCLDGRNVTAVADWAADVMRFTPEKSLSFGVHTLELTLRDTIGNRTYRRWRFAVGSGKKMHTYIGQVHCHTGDSDGAGTPEDAIRFARDVGNVDFFAVTDHSHFLSAERYAAQWELAEKYNQNGSFACICGFEMTWNNKNGYWGHMNVLNTDWHERRIDEVDLPAFYAELKEHPGAVAMFNHPGDKWGNFDDYAYRDEELAEAVCLSEIRGAGYDREYALMLSRGWRAAPVYNEDNHRPNWTRATDACGVVLAPSLTRENVLDAMRRRRTYTTLDRTLQIFYKVNGAWLGSALCDPSKLTVEVAVHTEHPQGIGLLELVSEDNIVVAHLDVGAGRDFTWQVELDPDFDYYYIRITNGELYAVTAPVFVTGRDLLNITSLKGGYSEDADDPHAIELQLANAATKAMSDVRVDFYLSPLSGFELRALLPYCSLNIGKLEAGESRTLAVKLPDVPGKRRVSAVVSGNIGKKRYADTGYLLLSPVLIGKLMPLSTKSGACEDPFPYIELYNPTPTAQPLKGYTLRLWQTLGKEPTPEHIFKFGKEAIPSESTLTLWCRPQGSTLTVADFNTHYGTNLVEGEDLIVCEADVLDAKPHGRRVDLMQGKELLVRASYGGFCSGEQDIKAGKPILFTYAPDMVVRAPRVHAVQKPAPGKLLPKQLPRRIEVLTEQLPEEQTPAAEPQKKLFTRLLHAPLVPFEAAALVKDALAAVRDLFKDKKS